MTRYVAQRSIESLIVLAVMSVVVYGLIGLMPGDPIDLMINANPNLTPADAARLKALYGLDLPLYERYWNWLTAALGGDFGYSRLFSRPVLEVLPAYLGRTAILMGASFVLSVAIAIPTGIWAATRPYSRADYVINLLSFAGISVAPFWLALLLIMLFAVGLGWLPAGGMQTVGLDSLADKAAHLVLPVLALTLLSVAGVTRYVRAEMIGVLRQDYVRTARAKGVPERQVVWRHGLRNALIPVVTVLALDFGALFSGALITETVFAYPGMGKLIYDAILGNDFNMALIGLLFATLLTLVGNLLADLAYAKLDPRISYG
ncbi:MAG TPA: ABC transporter permease [Alphaproteobacteria bacterium]|jgi:peptide/nickel transport system permease protein|nr:ABC transporter permease [Alphaproteobacteria bacterium]